MLIGCAVFSALAATGTFVTTDGRALPALVVAVVAPPVVAALAVRRRTGISLAQLLVTPVALAAATWLLIFAIRPLQLLFQPGDAALPLGQLGFTPQDLARAAAVAALGSSLWCIGYLAGLARTEPAAAPSARPATRPATVRGRGAAAALVVGTALWGLLFLRQGGPSALVHSPGSIRVNQTASFYGFVGVWMILGTTLYALVAMLQRPRRSVALVLVAGLVLGGAGVLSLQVRGLGVFAAIAAAAIYVALRPVRTRGLVVAAVVAAAGLLALGFAQQVRAYSQTVSTSEAVSLTMKTPLLDAYESDLSTFDNLVAMQSLVPGSIPYLDGRTIYEIPSAFVPRSLWPGKPTGIDTLVSSYLYPGVPVAVPISLQGELFWNGGVTLVAAGALVVGLLFGLLARVGRRAAARPGALVLHAVAVAFTYAFLTRGLATMAENLAFAVIGVTLAIVAVAPRASDEPVLTSAARRVTALLDRLDL